MAVGLSAVQPMAIFRHIPSSASVDHALVTSFSFSDDGLHGISASRDKALRLYDVGAILLRDIYTVTQTGCQRAIYTHSSDVVAFTPAHMGEAPLYLLNLSTGRVLAGIGDAVADQRVGLSKEFKEACAFKDALPSASPASPKRVDAPTSSEIVPLPAAASTSLALHPTTDIIVSVRKDGWGQLVVPTVGRPLALLKPTSGDEAYASRRRARIRSHMPLGVKTQNPADQTQSGGFNNNGSSPTTVWFEADADHATSSASFSPCGTYVAVNRSTTVSIYDMRNLSVGPVRVLASANLFAHRGRFEHDLPTSDKDTPVISKVQLASEGLLLATSTAGESTVVDGLNEYTSECDFNDGVRVLYHYNGGGYPAQYFNGIGEESTLTQTQIDRGGGAGYAMMPVSFPTPPSTGAIFATPTEGSKSMVVQPATRRGTSSSPYPVLVYEGHSSINFQLKGAGSGAAPAILSYQLLPRDSGPTQVLAANPRYSIVATASNTVHWWAF